MDLRFQPIVDDGGGVSGTLAQGHEVTGAYRASLALEEKVCLLEEARARQAMLLTLSDRLRSLYDNLQAMIGAASEALAAFFNAPRAAAARSRCGLALNHPFQRPKVDKQNVSKSRLQRRNLYSPNFDSK